MTFKIQSICIFLLCCGCTTLPHRQQMEFSFGIIADCQYCKEKGKGVRKYSLSKHKLSDCIEHFNKMDLEYVIHLGDFIDKGFESFDVVNPIYQKLNKPAYHVLGNHDYSVADKHKHKVPSKLNMPSRYYHFSYHGWRFIVLDGNEVSFHAHPKDSPAFKASEEYYLKNKIKSPKWNGAMGKAQLDWLRDQLTQASRQKEQVILFSHFPVYPDDIHNLWNDQELIALIENHDCVKAYINGHNHHGNYGVKEGIHYITFKGMVDTEQTSYAVIKLKGNMMAVEGFGREESREYSLKD